MSKKLYVGNLPFSITEDKIQELFAKHGQVSSAKLITDKYSGQSRGFGFVEMPNDAEAATATQSLHGTMFEGRALVVNEARPMEDRGPRGGGGGGRGGFGGGGGGGGRPSFDRKRGGRGGSGGGGGRY